MWPTPTSTAGPGSKDGKETLQFPVILQSSLELEVPYEENTLKYQMLNFACYQKFMPS